MSHHENGPHNYVHKSFHEQVIADLRERLAAAEKRAEHAESGRDAATKRAGEEYRRAEVAEAKNAIAVKALTNFAGYVGSGYTINPVYASNALAAIAAVKPT